MTILSKRSQKYRKGKKRNLKKTRHTKGGMMSAILTKMYQSYRDPSPDKLYPNGDKYYGELKNENPHGTGKMIYAKNGDVYEGHWENGKRSGHGIMTNNIFKEVYEGEWENGLLHRGTITSDLIKYEGNLMQNEHIEDSVLLYPVEGTMHYANGDKYVGKLANSYPVGQGTMHYANGDRYVGNFFQGQKHGHGAMTYAEGTKWTGIWSYDSKIRKKGAR